MKFFYWVGVVTITIERRCSWKQCAWSSRKSKILIKGNKKQKLSINFMHKKAKKNNKIEWMHLESINVCLHRNVYLMYHVSFITWVERFSIPNDRELLLDFIHLQSLFVRGWCGQLYWSLQQIHIPRLVWHIKELSFFFSFTPLLVVSSKNSFTKVHKKYYFYISPRLWSRTFLFLLFCTKSLKSWNCFDLA